MRIRCSQFFALFASCLSRICTSESIVGDLDHAQRNGARAFVRRDIKEPDPIPIDGQLDALEIMQTGRLYRYNVGPHQDSLVTQCERDLAAYTGHKYCIGLNSCGSALMLLLKTTGLEVGGKVLCNAFTFGAVPSAIVHAGGTPIYVESTKDMIIDLSDLEAKLQNYPDCKHLMISHMRGKVADMVRVKELCDRHKVILLEDCAHSLGVKYAGVHSGKVGVACAISSQSYKMINSGEGGFLLTDDPSIAARAAVYAGAYESLFTQHGENVPDQSYFTEYPRSLPNFSLRMSNLAAAVLRPQIRTLEGRIEKYNLRYLKLEADLKRRIGDHIFIPRLTGAVTRMVHDSLQFTLSSECSSERIDAFIRYCFDHGLPVELFGHKDNARNFSNWGFAPPNEPLSQTSTMLSRSIDLRLPLMWDDKDFDDLQNVLVEGVLEVLGRA